MYILVLFKPHPKLLFLWFLLTLFLQIYAFIPSIYTNKFGHLGQSQINFYSSLLLFNISCSKAITITLSLFMIQIKCRQCRKLKKKNVEDVFVTKQKCKTIKTGEKYFSEINLF